MMVRGEIKSGVLIRQDIDFICIKCSRPESLSINHNDSKMNQVFLEMVDSRLCLDCHCDKKVPEMVEVLLS